jgi:hypothetical protein
MPPKSLNQSLTSFYRRLYLAYLVDSGTNTVPAIMAKTGMPRRTTQDTLSAIPSITIELGNEGGQFSVRSWGSINKSWVENNVDRIRDALGCS